jgi:hypothetical protein
MCLPDQHDTGVIPEPTVIRQFFAPAGLTNPAAGFANLAGAD